MTTAIAQFMRELEHLWDEHTDALLTRHDVAAALATVGPGVGTGVGTAPSVLHLPAMTGAAGSEPLQRFYTEDFLPHLPADLLRPRISRTVDRFRLVDEMTVSFTHDRELPWLLPGVSPTFRRAEVLAIALVAFERRRIRSVRVLWDYATLTAQLGLPGLVASG